MHMKSSSQRGMSLISLMVALTIGTFVLAGLFDIWYETRQTFGAQTALAQLQDNERMALTIIANTVQTAGYYPVYENFSSTPPSPLYTPLSVFTASGSFSSKQVVYGTSSSTGSDTLQIRFMADGNTLDCLGQNDGATAAAPVLVTNIYSVDGNGDLQCAVALGSAAAGTPQTLVTGVSKFAVLYNVNNGTSTAPTYQYETAANVTTNGLWGQLQYLDIQLTFTNPLSSVQPGSPTTLPVISRIVALPQTGV
jgi:type IV pilus assembly protein PilW